METKRKGSSFQAISGKRHLESIFLFTTGRCNARCAMCFYAGDMEKKQPDMTFDQLKKVSETAGEINKLWLSGGEPTLREDLPDIIEMFYKNNHIKDINMPTNGLLSDRVIEWLKRLRKNCPDSNITPSISLDGFGEIHDKQRGVPSFYKAVETLKRIDAEFRNDGHIITNIATVITKFNVEQVHDFMQWVFGRLHASNHIIEAARGVTREDGVKVVTEQSLRQIQDDAAKWYWGYADRIADGVESNIGKKIARWMYIGLLRAMYSTRAANIDHSTPWNMDCTAGETTLVLDYDGRFRACELRPPIGNIADYDCDVQKIMASDAMKNEIAAIGHGYKANCWCTHGCWLMASILYNPLKAFVKLRVANKEMKAFKVPLDTSEAALAALEAKYNLDTAKLREIGVIR